MVRSLLPQRLCTPAARIWSTPGPHWLIGQSRQDACSALGSSLAGARSVVVFVPCVTRVGSRFSFRYLLELGTSLLIGGSVNTELRPWLNTPSPSIEPNAAAFITRRGHSDLCALLILRGASMNIAAVLGLWSAGVPDFGKRILQQELHVLGQTSRFHLSIHLDNSEAVFQPVCN